MQSVKLMSMVIHDFRGLKHFELDPAGESCIIRGANGTGKSTVQAAFLWLLTGKDAQGRENYNIFPLDEFGERISGAEPTVRASLLIGDNELWMQRTLAEKWVKKRGKSDPEYAGDETKFYLDDVPVSATEFQARMDKFFPGGMLPLLTNASYFSEQTKDYKERRKLLLESFGSITEEDVLDAHPELQPLRDAIGGHSVEEATKIYTERRKKYREEMQTIPARIDECRKAIPEDLPDEKEIEKERSVLGVELAKAQYERSHTSEARTVNELETQRADIRRKLQAIPAKLEGIKLSAAGDWNRRHQQALQEAQDAYNHAGKILWEAKQKRAEHEMQLVIADGKVRELRKQWAEVNNREADIPDVCPTCHRPLPTEMASESILAFNREKSLRLDKIAADGKFAASERERIEKLAENATQEVNVAEVQLADAKAKMELVQLEEPPAPPADLVSALDAEKSRLEQEARELESKIQDVQEAHRQENEALDAKIADLEEKRRATERAMARIDQAKQIKARIADLEESRRQAMKGLDNAERILDLCQKYTQAMIESLTGAINEHFETVRFRLFEQQKNGGLREICEASVDGVPYGALNTAAKMQANVEIVGAFARAARLSMPLFLDNRESVTDLRMPDGLQVISLMVDPGCRTMQKEEIVQ